MNGVAFQNERDAEVAFYEMLRDAIDDCNRCFILQLLKVVRTYDDQGVIVDEAITKKLHDARI